MTSFERVRARIDHPVIDSDGHHVEFLPLVKDYLREIAGTGAVSGFEQVEQASVLGRQIDAATRRQLNMTRMPWWGLPTQNTLDRATGEFLWATPSVSQNVVSHIDGATGAVSENSEVVFTADGQEVMACPTWQGGKDWEAGAYSPLTNHMYMPLRHTCGRMMADAGNGW